MNIVFARARRLSRFIYGGLFAGSFVGFGIVAFIGGIEIDRKPPVIQNVSIDDTVHAGDNLTVEEHVIVPAGCIPREMRMLSKFRDPNASGNEVQLLNDAPVVANGKVHIQVPRDTVPRPWFYEEIVSTSGCGPMSGIIQPQIAEVHDSSHQVGVAVTVLPYEIIPQH